MPRIPLAPAPKPPTTDRGRVARSLVAAVLCAVATLVPAVGTTPAPAGAASRIPTEVVKAAAAFSLSHYTYVTVRSGDAAGLAASVAHAAPVSKPLIVVLPATSTFTLKAALQPANNVYISAGSGARVTTTTSTKPAAYRTVWFRPHVTGGVYGGTWTSRWAKSVAVIQADGASARLSHLAVTGSPNHGIAAYGGSKGSSTLRLDHVSVSSSHTDGVHVEGTTLTASSLNSHSNRRNGLQASSHSSVTLTKSALDHNGTGVTGNTTGKTGHGLGVAASSVRATSTSFSSNKVCGISLTSRASVTISSSHLDHNGRHGVGTVAGVSVTLSTSTVTGNHYNGVLLTGSGTKATLSRVSIVGSSAYGISVPGPASVSLSHSIVTGSGRINVALDQRARATLGDSNTISQAKGSHGIAVSGAANLRVTGAGNAVSSNKASGVFVSGKGSSATIQRSMTIRSNHVYGLLVRQHATVRMVKCSISANHAKAVQTTSGGSVTNLK